MHLQFHKNRGVIGTVVLIVVALVLLGYYGVNVRTIVSSPLVQENLKYAWEILMNAIFNGFSTLVEFVRGLLPS
jgi:hypothetical protein